MDNPTTGNATDLVEQLIPEFRQITAARLGIGRAGGSLTSRQVLDFDLAHALARDAVNSEFKPELLKTNIESMLGENGSQLRIEIINSAASQRAIYLKRPDLGRRLAPESVVFLKEIASQHAELTVIISDGLSSQATMNQAPNVLKQLVERLNQDQIQKVLVLIIPFARVGISDHVGEILQSNSSIILLGERPGLATPESLGAYYTYKPRIGKTDADRNCISNIHRQGLTPDETSKQLAELITTGSQTGLSGVQLSEYMAQLSIQSSNDLFRSSIER